MFSAKIERHKREEATVSKNMRQLLAIASLALLASVAQAADPDGTIVLKSLNATISGWAPGSPGATNQWNINHWDSTNKPVKMARGALMNLKSVKLVPE